MSVPPAASVAVIWSLNLAMRTSLMVFTVGSVSGDTGWRVARSIALSRLCSRGVMNRIASPLRPARPVRPIRWV